jgi:hypothetical protein
VNIPPVNPVLFIEAIPLQVVASVCSIRSEVRSLLITDEHTTQVKCQILVRDLQEHDHAFGASRESAWHAWRSKDGALTSKRHPTMPVYPQEANATMLPVCA